MYGAPESDALGPIGGGEGYRNGVELPDRCVSTIDELRRALDGTEPGGTVYVDDGAEIDMTVWVRACDWTIDVPDGVTLASGRGVDGSLGALIYSDEFATAPLIRTGAGARITGLRVRGPDTKVRSDEVMRLYHEPKITHDGTGYYSFPTSTGIETTHTGLVVDNTELWGWSNTAISLLAGALNAHVHHCDIHHCQRAGLGYGVLPHGGSALIECNRFDYMRHAIAGSGIPDTAYEARYNIHGSNSISHCFDMHGSEENNVLVDGQSIAGEYVLIHHNTFNAAQAAVGIRGVPRDRCEIHNNWFAADFDGPRVVIVGPGTEQAHAEFRIRDNVAGPSAATWSFSWEDMR
jgi:hypothetical protein